MCGILGISAPESASMHTARRMLATLTHRGPDGHALTSLDDGRLILGHARLAVVDLSPTGAQPMALPTGRLWITYNGEIYNYLALRQQLEAAGHRFSSTSDTEVLLAGYAAWGEDVLDKLDGIFAFAIWDGSKRRLWLARDHIGVKPLYFIRDARRFAFASEPRALLCALDRAPRPNPEALRDFLSFGYLPGSRSAYAGIEKLPPAHALVVSGDELRTYRYWDSAALVASPLSRERQIMPELVRRLDGSVASQLESDVPVGVIVSGGIDSSVVATSALRGAHSLHGFVVGYEESEFDERPYARLLARDIAMTLSEYVLTPSLARSILDDVVHAYDEPLADTSSVASLALFRFVRDQSYKVVMGGDGGDELFSGYVHYDRLLADEGACQAPWPSKIFGARSLRQAARIAARPRRYRRAAWRSHYERVRMFSFEQQRSILREPWRPEAEADLTWPFARYWDPHLETLQAARLYDLQTYLPDDILTKVDRASMHYGVEARVPLLARRVVEHAFRIPTAIHRKHGSRKYLLKRVLHDRAPRELLTNRKKGFGLPLAVSIGEELRRWFAGIETSELARSGFIAPHAFDQSRYNLDQIWALYTLDRWWSRWISHAHG